MKCVIILAAVVCFMAVHVQSQAGGQTAVNARQMAAMRAGAAAAGNGGQASSSSLLPLLAMGQGKLNPAMLSMLMSRGGQGGMSNLMPYLLMADGGMGENMLPMLALMGNRGGAGNEAGSGNALMNMMMLRTMFN